MIDLKSILCTYPNCLNSRATFRSILMDKYPNEKRIVNILTILVDCGIVHKIRNKAALDDSEMQKLVLQLETDYGIMPQYAVECISIWANAFDIPINPAQTAVPAYEPIFHVPIAQSVEVVEGSQSDYKSTVLYGRKTLSKFIGIDEKIVTVPNRIDGLPVEAIGKDVFANCLGIEKIIIPEGITEIRDRAFRGCEALKEVNLPKGRQFIGERAFDVCKCLTEIH